jgi:DUF4097 and DUF4098 domain-containing protein YvlB
MVILTTPHGRVDHGGRTDSALSSAPNDGQVYFRLPGVGLARLLERKGVSTVTPDCATALIAWKEHLMSRIPTWTLILPALLLTGCFVNVEDRSFDLTEYEFTSFDITNPAGSINIVAGDTVSMDAELRYMGDRIPEIDITLQGETLVVEVECPPGPGECSVSHEITLPVDTILVSHASSGGTTITGMEASLDVTSTSGGVTIRDHIGDVSVNVSSGSTNLDNVSGDIDLESSSGGITATRLDASAFTGHVTSGTMIVEMDTAPDDVSITSTSGGVDVTVPEDSYNLRLEATSGSINVVGLTDEDQSDKIIDITVTSGGISVTGD